jgi:hypothetical protein
MARTMIKKDYCLKNEAIAVHNYYKIQIHGIEYGIDDYVYLSRLYQKSVSFHRVKINYYADGGTYIKVTETLLNGKKHVITLALNDFIRVASGWGVSIISCDELKNLI